jgi:N-acetylglucosamine-6-phosphate deacetylase
MLGPEGLGPYRVIWGATGPNLTPATRAAPHYLVPGFVDLHIHGAFGIDFMTADLAHTAHLADLLWNVGYEGFLPTTVTGSAADVSKAVANLPAHRSVLGFHLEGPFISPSFPGAQPAEKIVTPPVGPSEWDPILEHPSLRLVTLAPEIPRGLELATRLLKRGVRVNMGHTNATYEEARRGYEFGVSGSTHTYNAMRGLHHREAGALGYLLRNDDLFAEIIYDRIHVCRDAADLLFKVKPSSRVVAVSDGTMASGLEPGTKLNMWGIDVVVGVGDVRLASNQALAGSAITLADAFRNLAQDFGPEVAIRLCCLNPRSYLGMKDPPRRWLELNKEFQVIGSRELRN